MKIIFLADKIYYNYSHKYPKISKVRIATLKKTHLAAFFFSPIRHKYNVKHIKIVVSNGMFCITALKLFPSIVVSRRVMFHVSFALQFVAHVVKSYFEAWFPHNSIITSFSFIFFFCLTFPRR